MEFFLLVHVGLTLRLGWHRRRRRSLGRTTSMGGTTRSFEAPHDFLRRSFFARDISSSASATGLPTSLALGDRKSSFGTKSSRKPLNDEYLAATS